MGSKKLKSCSSQGICQKSTAPPTNEGASNRIADEEDFCQHFFGDPLFSNLNVLLLFLLATFLPMLVWIPHIVNEYATTRLINAEEGERLKRMEQSRLDLTSQERLNLVEDPILQAEKVIMTPFSDDDVVFQEDVFRMKTTGVKHEDGGETLASSPRKPSVSPKLCSDGKTLGFDNWFHLKDAISEANALAAEDFLRWNKYLVASINNPDLEEPVFDVPDPFIICPGAKLNQRHPPRVLWSWLTSFFFDTPNQYKPNSNKLSSIYINAEDITIQCDRCSIDLPGTHFSFGPHATAWIKGITFRGATTSSLTLHHHGATASFEDCYWLHNSGGIVASKNNPIGMINLEGNSVGGTMNGGAVADVNSTSSITFFRCCIDDQRQNPRRANVGAGEIDV